MELAEIVTETVDCNSGIKGKSDLKLSQISMLENRRRTQKYEAGCEDVLKRMGM